MQAMPEVRGRFSFAEDLLGQVLGGRYLLTHLLGRGSHGAVYHAIQHATRRAVAVKVLMPVAGRESANRRARFIAEAVLLSKLCHPNNATFLDHGESAGGHVYTVQALLHGRALATEIWRVGRLEPRRAITIAIEALRGLAEAHALGVVHRDVKPANLMLWRDTIGRERVKVLDYGIARGTAYGVIRDVSTAPGCAVGTPLFMSPEQARGRRVSPASDVYAIGAVLYLMLVGRPPFVGDDPRAVMQQHVDGPLPRLDGIPPTLAGVIRRAMARDPSARFGRAADMMHALEAARAEVDARGGRLRPVHHWPETPAGWLALPLDAGERGGAPAGQHATRGAGCSSVDTPRCPGPEMHAADAGSVAQRRGGALFGLVAAAGIGLAILAGSLVGEAMASRLQRSAEATVRMASEAACPANEPPRAVDAALAYGDALAREGAAFARRLAAAAARSSGR